MMIWLWYDVYHFVRSIAITFGLTITGVENMWMYSLQSCSWSSEKQANVIIGHTRDAFWMDLSSIVVRDGMLKVDSSIDLRSATWGDSRAGQMGDKPSSSLTSRECCHFLESQMGCIICNARDFVTIGSSKFWGIFCIRWCSRITGRLTMISMQLSMTVAESQVEDYAAVYGARLAPALVKCLRTLWWLDPSDCLPNKDRCRTE